MAEPSTNIDNSAESDEELANLLDSALEDFNKLPPSNSKPETNNSDISSASKTEEPWNHEFLVEAQKSFEQNMKSLFGPGQFKEDISSDIGGDGDISAEQFGEQLQKIADEANKVLNEHSQDPEFSATIAQTLKNLSDNSEKMQAGMGPDALSAVLGSLGLGTEEDSANDFMPFMQSMMQSFLSKEVLYSSIKEITEKYPVWLQENKDNLSETDYKNYTSQYELMNQMCLEFEKETENDTEEVKKERFLKIFSFMEEMQKLGQPPKDLCDEPPFSFDELGSPNGMPGVDPSQCVVM